MTETRELVRRERNDEGQLINIYAVTREELQPASNEEENQLQNEFENLLNEKVELQNKYNELADALKEIDEAIVAKDEQLEEFEGIFEVAEDEDEEDSSEEENQ